MCIYMYTYAYTCVDACAHDVYTLHTRQVCPVYMQVCKDMCVPLLKVCTYNGDNCPAAHKCTSACTFVLSLTFSLGLPVESRACSGDKKGKYSIGFHRLSKQVSLHSLNNVK